MREIVDAPFRAVMKGPADDLTVEFYAVVSAMEVGPARVEAKAMDGNTEEVNEELAGYIARTLGVSWRQVMPFYNKVLGAAGLLSIVEARDET
jgi:hypothetical protein